MWAARYCEVKVSLRKVTATAVLARSDAMTILGDAKPCGSSCCLRSPPNKLSNNILQQNPQYFARTITHIARDDNNEINMPAKATRKRKSSSESTTSNKRTATTKAVAARDKEGTRTPEATVQAPVPIITEAQKQAMVDNLQLESKSILIRSPAEYG